MDPPQTLRADSENVLLLCRLTFRTVPASGVVCCLESGVIVVSPVPHIGDEACTVDDYSC